MLERLAQGYVAVCVCVGGGGYHRLVCELNLDSVQLSAIDLEATTRPKKAGLCDWPSQRDFGLHYCKSLMFHLFTTGPLRCFFFFLFGNP